jgi:hypothetical protein
MGNSMHTDAQWRWLYDRYKEGYFYKELASFAGCSEGNLCCHWKRLKLTRRFCEYKPLNREEFESLGGES